MAQRIVSIHAAHRSGKEVIDGFLSRPTVTWVGNKKIAVLDFCMGGGLALYALAQSKVFAAGVIIIRASFRTRRI